MAKRLPTAVIDTMDPALLAAIGEVVARWGYLEFQLRVVIREACRLSKETGLLITARAPLAQLCSTLATIGKSPIWVADVQTRDAISKLAKGVESRRRARNTFAHAIYGEDPADGSIVQWLFQDPSNKAPTLKPIDVGGVRAEAQHARDLWEEAQAITKTLKGRNRKK
jgi:hypothetical protein